MNYDSLNQKKTLELIALCREDKELYKGFSKFKKKEELVNFILSKGQPISEQYDESNEDIGGSLDQLFQEPEESRNDLFRARPTREDLDKKILEVTNQVKSYNGNNSVVFDVHDDEEQGLMYRIHKHKIFKKYGTLGGHGEIILFHGTDERNVNGILDDDFSLTVSASHGHRHGKGIYFTNCIDKAIYYSEKLKPVKYVFVCLVHVGDIMIGNMNTDVHLKIPSSECSRLGVPLGKTYDTSVDNLHSPIQFVKKKNGTYNILGVLKIDMKQQVNPRNMSVRYPTVRYPTGGSSGQSNLVPLIFNQKGMRCNLEIANKSDDDIKVYWVPTNIDIYDPQLDVRSHGKYMGLIVKGGSSKWIAYKDHRFMCANKVGYVRIIEIDERKKNVILT
jgi:hypothetical protein